MIPQDIEELVKKYPNNYELGEEVRKFYDKKKNNKNFKSGKDSKRETKSF